MTGDDLLLEALALQVLWGADESVGALPLDKKTFQKETFTTPKLSQKKSEAPALQTSLESPSPIPPPSLKDTPVLKKSRSASSTLHVPFDTTRAHIKAAKSLDELKALMTSFDACDLKKTAIHTVFGDGSPNAPVMCVGEAPGADEDRRGLPFVGLSGQLLDKMLATINLSREKNVYISNIIPWRPPGNRPPTPQESALCLPFIERHIELVKPRFLILLGGTAAKTLLQTKEGIMTLRRRWHMYQSEGLESPIPTMTLFHPAYLLRSPGQKRVVWLDLLKLQESLASPHPPQQSVEGAL